MRTLIALILIVGAVYYGWQYLPESIRAKGEEAWTTFASSRFSPLNLLPPLKAKLGLEDPVAKRAKLIDQLGANIKTLAETTVPKTTQEKAIVANALSQSQQLITELKTENPEGGIIARTADRLTDLVLPPSKNVSCPAPTQ